MTRKTYRHYPVLTADTFWKIRDSIAEEHRTQNYVSRAWLIERLAQCICALEGLEVFGSKVPEPRPHELTKNCWCNPKALKP